MRSLTFQKLLLALLAPLTFAAIGIAQEPAAEGTRIQLGRGRLTLMSPAGWIKKTPSSRIVEFEFAAPGKEKGADARVTLMGASGGVEANVSRWEGQFASADGEAVKASTEKLSVAGCEVHLVDLRGIYLDRPGGPFAGGQLVRRPDYRMLGAIIITPDAGQYYIKMYGPMATVEAQAESFKKMVADLKAK